MTEYGLMIMRVLSYTQIKPWWDEIRINPLHHLYLQPKNGG